MTSRDRGGTALYYATLILIAYVVLWPILLMLATSLKLRTQILADSGFSFFFTPTLRNYEVVLGNDRLVSYLWNSLIVGTVSTVITIVLGCMAAYAIARFRFLGRDVVSVSTLLLRLVPPAVLAVPVFLIWTYEFAIDRTLSGLVLVYTAMNLPFVIWILQGFIDQTPPALEEAARVDGAGPFQTFFHVVLPLIRPGISAAAIFTFRIAWNEFILALQLTGRSTRTIPVQVSLSITEHGVEWGEIMALGTIIALPPLVFTFLAARQIISGLTAGAVKG